MNEEAIALARVLRRDSRYPLEAYLFVREGLNFTADKLELHNCNCLEPLAGNSGGSPRHDCHISGQQLCDGIRQYALAQFGLMARTVLNSWGIQTTSDFGEIVYNLIRVGILKKSPDDRRSHFDDVFDFEIAFERDFEIAAAFPTSKS